MKILHLLQSNRFSGAENVVCQIIEMFKNNSDVEMAYCSRDGEIRYALEERDIKFFPMAELKPSEVKRVINEYRPDIIHAHDMRASFVAALVCGQTTLVSHIHNSDFQARRISAKSIAFFLTKSKYKNVIWVSNSCYNSYYFNKAFSNKSTVLYNVIGDELVRKKAEIDKNDYDYDMVYIGRLAHPKNPMRLIRIISLIKQQKGDVKVGIVGCGNLEDTTKAEAKRLGVIDSIVFHGFMSNPLGVLKAAKVMVMTSDREGLPMCALEAMALGVPIVSTPTDGLCDVVKHDVTGYLEWDERILAQHILSLISDNVKRQNFSRATLREFARINDIENYKGVLNEIYRLKQ